MVHTVSKGTCEYWTHYIVYYRSINGQMVIQYVQVDIAVYETIVKMKFEPNNILNKVNRRIATNEIWLAER